MIMNYEVNLTFKTVVLSHLQPTTDMLTYSVLMSNVLLIQF